jgi:UDP-N-acetylglucosamine acyltransferase
VIDPRAVVDPAAEIGEGVEIGPFAVVEAGVSIGDGCRIGASSYFCRGTRLGRDNVVHMGVVLGNEPQDLAYRGAPTTLQIGDRNVFREGCQVHRGTAEGSSTVIGNDCYLMTNAHVAHNCRLGDAVILATGAVLGGHVSVGDRAFLSGNILVHQYTRIGRLALLQGGAAVSRDVAPFLIARIGRNELSGVNVVGMRRAGLAREAIAAVRRAYRTLFLRRRNLRAAREQLFAEEEAHGALTAEVREMLEFIERSKRGVCFAARAPGLPRSSGAEDEDAG